MTTQAASTEAVNKQLVSDFMEAFSTGNVEKTLAYMDESATWWIAGTMEGISGTHSKDAFRQLLSGIAAETKTGAIRLTPKAWTVEGDRVAVETESYAEVKNGRVYNNLYHFVFEVRDGKIHSVREYLDTEHTSAVFLGA